MTQFLNRRRRIVKGGEEEEEAEAPDLIPSLLREFRHRLRRDLSLTRNPAGGSLGAAAEEAAVTAWEKRLLEAMAATVEEELGRERGRVEGEGKTQTLA